MQPFWPAAWEGDQVGTWGTSLYANDLTSDIRGDYVDGLEKRKDKLVELLVCAFTRRTGE